MEKLADVIEAMMEELMKGPPPPSTDDELFAAVVGPVADEMEELLEVAFRELTSDITSQGREARTMIELDMAPILEFLRLTLAQDQEESQFVQDGLDGGFPLVNGNGHTH